MDIIIPALIRHNCMEELLEECGFDFEKHELPYSDIPIKVKVFDNDLSDIMQIKEQGQSALLEEKLDNPKLFADEGMLNSINEKMNFEYPYSYLDGLTVKTSVSELKRAAYEEAQEAVSELVMPEKKSYIPDFVSTVSEISEENDIKTEDETPNEYE